MIDCGCYSLCQRAYAALAAGLACATPAATSKCAHDVSLKFSITPTICYRYSKLTAYIRILCLVLRPRSSASYIMRNSKKDRPRSVSAVSARHALGPLIHDLRPRSSARYSSLANYEMYVGRSSSAGGGISAHAMHRHDSSATGASNAATLALVPSYAASPP